MENRKWPEANPGYESNSHDPRHGGKKMPRHKLAEAIASSWAHEQIQWCPCVLRSLKPIEVTNYALGLVYFCWGPVVVHRWTFTSWKSSWVSVSEQDQKVKGLNWQSGLVFCFALPFLFSLYHSLGTCSNSPTTHIMFKRLNVLGIIALNVFI